MVRTLEEMRIPVTVIHSEKAFDFRIWGAVSKFVREQQIDLVHVHGTRANTNMLPVSGRLRLPVIYTVHGWSFHHGLPFYVHKARTIVERWITRRTALNITVSESNRQTGLAAFGSFRAVVVRNGIDLQRFHPDRASAHLRQHYGFSDDNVVVGFIARMTDQKDPLGLITAFAAAYARQPQLRLLMVGDGPMKAAAINLVQSLGISHAVVMDQFRSDVPELLRAIDVYCLPSLWEGYPIGVLEAMAMGKAVIATDVDGTPEAFDNEISGLLVPPANPQALTHALERVAADEGLRKKLGAAAMQKAAAEHGIAAMTAKIAEVYNNIFMQGR
jgi:glycosyltransferase involved in cell wall biosynthesis